MLFEGMESRESLSRTSTVMRSVQPTVKPSARVPLRMTGGRRPAHAIQQVEVEALPVFVPPAVSREDKIDFFARKMAFGNDLPEPGEVKSVRVKSEAERKKDRSAELVKEIDERLEFMRSMKGTKGRDGRDYDAMMKAQVSELLRELEEIDAKARAQF